MASRVAAARSRRPRANRTVSKVAHRIADRTIVDQGRNVIRSQLERQLDCRGRSVPVLV